MADKISHIVTVGNIGNVVNGGSFREASEAFREYVRQSRYGIGRAAGEHVIWWRSGEPYQEYIPESQQVLA